MSKPRKKRQYESTYTGIHVQPGILLHSNFCQLLDGVNHAVWVRKRRPDDHDGILIYGAAHSSHVGPQGFVRRHDDRLDPQEMGRLVESGMS